MSWRFIATRPDGAGNETVLHWDVPLDDPSISNTLSGPDVIRGTISPETLALKTLDGRPLFEKWGTCLYAEENGVIRAGTIVTDLTYRGATLTVEGTGFAGYPSRMPFLGGTTTYRTTDPAAICASIWSYLQGQRNGNLGVVTNFAPTPIRTGAYTTSEAPQARNSTTGRYENDDTPRALVLSYETTFDLGRVIDSLAESTPFDYVESHRWSGEKIVHEIRSGYPSIGRRRNDLRFVEGENVYTTPDVMELSEDYASELMILGTGEGSKRVRATTSRSGEKRLRRATLVTDRSVTSTAAAQDRARAEIAARTGAPEIRELLVVDHPHAPSGSYGLGDEVLYQMGPSGWQSSLEMWVRIVQITYSPDDSQVASLTVTPVT